MERAVGRLTGEFYLTCHPSEEALVLASSCGKQRGTKGYWFGLNSRSVEANRCVSRPSDGFLGINCIISRFCHACKESQPATNKPVCPSHLLCQLGKLSISLLHHRQSPFAWFPWVWAGRSLQNGAMFSQPTDVGDSWGIRPQ